MCNIIFLLLLLELSIFQSYKRQTNKTSFFHFQLCGNSDSYVEEIILLFSEWFGKPILMKKQKEIDFLSTSDEQFIKVCYIIFTETYDT
jgi:hypothetical protein